MYVQPESGEGIVAYHVMNLTPSEMLKICKMDKKIADVLITHHPEYKGKKQYLSNEDLFALRGILQAIARYADNSARDTFDDVKDELVKAYNEAHCSNAASTDE